MKITDFKNEDAIDLLVDLVDPATEIFSDKELLEAIKSKAPTLKAVKIALKNHKKALITILAVANGVPVEEYKCNPVTIITDVLELLSDKELISFFQKQQQMALETPSTSAMETTEATEEM